MSGVHMNRVRAAPLLLPLVLVLLLAASSAAQRAAGDAWRDLIAEYVRGDPGRLLRPVPIELPVAREGSATVLVVPVPVFMQGAPPAAQCALSEGPEARQRPAVVEPPATHFVPPPLHVLSLSTDGTWQQLVELFRAQKPAAIDLPPLLIPDYDGHDEELASPVPPAAIEPPQSPPPAALNRRIRNQVGARPVAGPGAVPVVGLVAGPVAGPDALRGDPPRPEFSRSATLRGELTVPGAGYTEPYVVRWAADSGSARVDYHGGGTSTFRTVSPDGSVRHVEVRVDRTGEEDVVRCITTEPSPATSADRTLPGLPDLTGFSFAGYVEAQGGVAESWVRTVHGVAGEPGGARGEALTFRHEFLVQRAPADHSAVPLRYTVSADSSVLGADYERYEHRYLELRHEDHEPAMLRVDVEEVCEDVQSTTRRERVEPLREYVLPRLDPRYDYEFAQFVSRYNRSYANDAEEAVRKALFVRATRFVNSGQRQAGTAQLAMNEFGDRLDAELNLLLGVDTTGAEERPSASGRGSRVRRDATRLPREFDWRERGAVTNVRYQGSCSSCWAFAVAGAVEGALFRSTGRLVPLSEQRLVDCAHPYGGHGCGGTWPRAAYDYIQERGLSALHEYLPYQERKLECAERQAPAVTHISGHLNVTTRSVRALQTAVRQRGPAVVIVDAKAKGFVYYKGGVLRDERCAKRLRRLNHAVLAVGWAEHRREPHFVLKNSWSARWGEGGYVRMHAPSNTCGVLTQPSVPLLDRQDVRRLPEPMR